MCGGSIEVLPCSHVGHVFRHRAVHNYLRSTNSRKNYLRVAEVWLDEYKDLFYQKINYQHKEAAVCLLVVVSLLCFFVESSVVRVRESGHSMIVSSFVIVNRGPAYSGPQC